MGRGSPYQSRIVGMMSINDTRAFEESPHRLVAYGLDMIMGTAMPESKRFVCPFGKGMPLSEV